ncbi:hypothetical protein WJX79_005806 [Trebouxia sp. C0005]
MDDDLDDIDFSAIDQIVENHQARQRGSQAGPRPAAVHHPSGPVGRVSQAAAALGQQHQQQHMQWQQAGAAAAAGPDVQYSNRENQLHAEKEELQQLLKAAQGRNTMLKQSLERKERERDDLQSRMQQLSSQSTGTSSVTIAEAQKEIATLKQEMAFKENEIHELKRRCAEKDQAVQPLEAQVNHLQQERERIQQELDEAYRERRERGAGASTSFDPPPVAPRMNSPSPSRGRKPASGARSSKSTTGVKRKLANVLGSPAGTPGGTPSATPMQNGHAPLPLQSVANGQVSNREGPPARQSGVAQNQDSALKAAAPATPDLPAHELPSWSRFPQSTSHASTTLQQLWLKCPDSFSLLLTPQHPRFPAHPQTAQDSAAQPSDSHEMTRPQSEALTQLTVPSNDSAPSGSIADRLMAAALHVTAALIACDKACQQAVTSRLTKDQINAQAPAQNKEADVASLHLGGLRLSARLTISFGDDSGLARPVLPANPSRAQARSSTGGNKQLDKLLLDLIIKLLLAATAPSVVQPALSCLLAMVAVTPSDSRAAFAPLITSGMLQQLLCQPQHAQQALQLLHLLVQSVSLCQVLNAGLDEGFQLEGGTATAPSPPLRPGGVQEDAAGHSASSPMEIDVDNNDTKDQPTSWTGTTELLDCLVASLQIHSTYGNPPQDPPDPNPDPHKPQPTPHLPPAVNPKPERGEGGKDMGLCQSLLEMVDSVTRGQSDSLLAAFTPPADPSTAPFVTPRSLPPHPSPSNNSSAAARRAIDPGCKTDGQAVAAGIDRASDLESEAYAWQENVRLSQEALTLLRVLLVDSVLGQAAIEDLSSSSSAIRLSLITTTRLLHWADGPAGIKLQTTVSPLPLQQWYVLLATANKASQLEQAKLVWGHHLPLRWRNSQTFTSVQRAIGWFVVANCIASKIFIIAVASIHCAQAKADRMPALTGHEVIKMWI